MGTWESYILKFHITIVFNLKKLEREPYSHCVGAEALHYTLRHARLPLLHHRLLDNGLIDDGGVVVTRELSNETDGRCRLELV